MTWKAQDLKTQTFPHYDKQHRHNTPTRCLISLLWYIPGQGRLYKSMHNLACCTCAVLLRITTTFPSQRLLPSPHWHPEDHEIKPALSLAILLWVIFRFLFLLTKTSCHETSARSRIRTRVFQKIQEKNGTKRQLYFSAKTHPKLRCSLLIHISRHSLKTLV